MSVTAPTQAKRHIRRGVGFDEGGTHGNARHPCRANDKRRPLTGDLPSTPKRVSSSAAQLRDAFHRIAEDRQSGVGIRSGHYAAFAPSGGERASAGPLTNNLRSIDADAVACQR
jgi:hypothetical protein